jgi:ABC-2 type transport system ATP-binding protein
MAPECGRVTWGVDVRELTKRRAEVAAVDGLTFTVGPGQVTRFPGPNGAGRTTTVRVILGSAAPASGEALGKGHRSASMLGTRQRLTAGNVPFRTRSAGRSPG